MRTALYDEHLKLDAKMVDFHGWEMPIHYKAGILKEHDRVRNSVGIFDVSHMGQIVVEGREACDQLQTLYTNDILNLEIGKAVYTHILREDGTIIDDTIVYRLAADAYLAIPNASMIDVIYKWMCKYIPEGVTNLSDELACLAVQGPKTWELMQKIFGDSINNMKRFSFMSYDLDSQSNYTIHTRDSTKVYTGSNETVEKIMSGKEIMIARTGYTGENGYELIVHNDIVLPIWQQILESGGWQSERATGQPADTTTPEISQTSPILPIGLGARDTLRLEMGYLLSGEDFDGSQTPLESASSWVVKWDHDFIGKVPLLEQKESKAYDRLVGIKLEKRLAARHGTQVFPAADTEINSPVEMEGYPLPVTDSGDSVSENLTKFDTPETTSVQHGQPIGTVTSGGFAPTVGTAIAMARVKKQFAKAGTPLEIEVRGRRLKGTVVKMPFLKK